MRQIRDTSILVIDITNACIHNCSNCSRFCGHHKKTYFMDFETFKRAVDSLDGYGGLISIIGGEPLLHPEYSRFVSYLRKVRGDRYLPMDDGRCKAIVKDYPAFIKAQRWFQGAMNRGRGYCMFSSVSGRYFDHYEEIEDTITDLWLNDHKGASSHQPILVSRKDLGIGDEEFQVLRDHCWLKDYWSANITPKGVFFCEIAGTLDMLFHGPGGKKIEPGWWDRDIMDFSDQFHWCDLCGMALHTYSRNANDEVDDVSQTLMEMLKQAGSPKLAKKQVQPFHLKNALNQEGLGLSMEDAMAKYVTEKERFGSLAENLKPKCVYLCQTVETKEQLHQLEEGIERYRKDIDGICVITKPTDQSCVEQMLKRKGMAYKLALAESIPQSMGGRLNLAIGELGRQEWILLCEAEPKLPERFAQRICDYYLNPGYLFFIEHHKETALMLSGTASAIKRAGFDRLQACMTLKDIAVMWGKKVCILDDSFEKRPDTDIPYFRRLIRKEYEKDLNLQYVLKRRMEEKGVQKGSAILLIQSAYVYHTIGIWQVLEGLGYDTYLLSSSIFQDYFDGMVRPDRMIYFSENGFCYAKQESMRKHAGSMADFAGAVVPISRGPSTVKYIDDYTDVLRTAENTAGRILGIINIRRQFAELDYDIWNYEKQE